MGDLAPERAIERYREALAQYDALAAQSYPFRPEEFREELAIARRLGLAQFGRQDYLSALATFSRGLQIAERVNDRALVAAAHLYIAEALAHNGAASTSLASFRKALDGFASLAGVSLPTPGLSPAEHEKALAEIAAAAPPDLRKSMEFDLAAFTRLRGRIAGDP